MTTVIGSLENVLFEQLKVQGIRQQQNLVHMRPQIRTLTPSAPTKSKKFHSVKVEFAFDSSCFVDPKSIHAFLVGTHSHIFGFRPHDLTPETIKLGADTGATHKRLLDKYPELKQLWNDFLPKWEAAYARALENSTDYKKEIDVDATT